MINPHCIKKKRWKQYYLEGTSAWHFCSLSLDATHILFIWVVVYLLYVQKSFVPKRYFSIDRVFRNEAVDRTHLAEFHQIEGVYLSMLIISFTENCKSNLDLEQTMLFFPGYLTSSLISGLICDRGLSLGDLLGVLEDFFSRLGMTL